MPYHVCTLDNYDVNTLDVGINEKGRVYPLYCKKNVVGRLFIEFPPMTLKSHYEQHNMKQSMYYQR